MDAEKAHTLRSALDQMKLASDEMKSASDNMKSAFDQIKTAYTSFASATEIIRFAFLKPKTSASTQTDEELPPVECKASIVESGHALDTDEGPKTTIGEVALNDESPDESETIDQSPVSISPVSISRKRTATPDRSQKRSKISRSLSMDVRKAITAPSPISTPLVEAKEPLVSNASRAAKVTRPRKTIGIYASHTEVMDNSPALNVNPEQYSKNDLYNSLCLYCGSNERFLVPHYLKHHPKFEVPIARPSPQMADRIRSQVQMFDMQDRKIKGLCYFCEDIQEKPRSNWTTHYLRHTGEPLFACDTCGQQFERKVQKHGKCPGDVLNIIDVNSTDDASLMGYMCKDCNYMRLHLPSMRKHLDEQHGYALIAEGDQYDKVTLVPDMTPAQADILEENESLAKRFVCTICKLQSLTADDFVKHYDERHNGITKYKCLCGETVASPALNGKMIAEHLCLHSNEFHQCLLCDGFFDDRIAIRWHIVLQHRDSENIKYRQFVRAQDGQQSKVLESNIHRFKCNLENCQKELKGTFGSLFDHFQQEHSSMTGDATVYVSKRSTLLANESSKVTTRFVGSTKLNYQISTE